MFLSKKITKNILPILASIFIVIGILTALFAYVISPDSSRDANNMHVSIATQSPGFGCYMLQETNQYEAQSWFDRYFFGVKTPTNETPILENFKISKSTLNYIPLETREKTTITLDSSKKVVYKKFYLGTDKYGRDLLSRILIGARISFSIGFIAVLISLVIGLTVGAIAGYFGKLWDTIIMWFINVTWSVPTILLVIAITVSLGKGLWQIYIAVGLTMWVEVARVVRGQIISLKNQQYIEAAKVLGLSHFTIIKNHILPNIIGPIIVISASNFASAILVESGLSFLGLGAQPPTPTWGTIIKNHYNYIITGKAYLAIIPGMLIVITVLSFMLMGNFIRDYYNKK